MKISTLIKRLEAAREKYGDLPVGKDDCELGFLPATYLGVDGIDNVPPRWTQKQVAVVNKGRKKNDLLPLTSEEIKEHTQPRPVHKPKFVWI